MIIRLNETYKIACIQYMKKQKGTYDDYFLSDEVLDQFKLSDDITYILLENKQITGVISIMKKYGTRLRVLYTDTQSYESYQRLHSKAIEKINGSSYKVFINASKSKEIEQFKDLGLAVERTIYSLRRDINDIEVPDLKPDYSIRTMSFPEDLESYCHIRNTAFKNLTGSSDRTPESLAKMHLSQDYLKETTLMMSHHNQAIAIIKGGIESENGQKVINIGPIAVLPEYQGKALGRQLLASLIKIVQTMGPWPCELSVNTDNEHALKLYTDLGFYIQEKVIALI